MITRRLLLATAAPAALCACTSSDLTNIQQQWATFIDQVNAILAAGCSTVIPAFTATATTIEAVVNILYPGVGAAVAGIVGAVNTVASAICATQPAAGLRARLAKSNARLPIVIGTTVVHGIPVTVTGYK